MRSPSLGTGLLALVVTAVVCVPGAQADPTPPGPAGPAGPPDAAATATAPSGADVRAAQDRVAGAEQQVATVQQRLTDAAAELDAATVRAAKAAEAWNGARWRARTARETAERATTRAADAAEALTVHEDAFRDALLTAQGMGLELSALDVLVEADGIDGLLEQTSAHEHVQALFDQRRDAYLAAAAAARETADTAAAASAEADRTLARARAARDEARAAARDAAAITERIEQRRTRLVRRLARLQGVSVAVARAHQAAVDAHAAQHATGAKAADHSTGDGTGDGTADAADTAGGTGAAEQAVAFARDQLGERYRWGAAGPDAWDCSGLVARAWAAGGKELPHYSVAQYEQATPITRDRLRPGDLVFWADGAAASSIFHVALYVGDGRIVHAPRTGRPVTEESIDYWRAPDFFARP